MMMRLLIKDHQNTKTTRLPENISHPQLNNPLNSEIKQQLKPEQKKINKAEKVMLNLLPPTIHHCLSSTK